MKHERLLERKAEEQGIHVEERTHDIEKLKATWKQIRNSTHERSDEHAEDIHRRHELSCPGQSH